MKKILILCTANSARSQMAEGLLKNICDGAYEVESAGTFATSVRPEAIQVLSEIGIDISMNRSKSVEEFSNEHFDFVLTVCGDANANCPYFPAQTAVIHRGFDDPAAEVGNELERIDAFRKVRDELKQYLEGEFLRIVESR